MLTENPDIASPIAPLDSYKQQIDQDIFAFVQNAQKDIQKQFGSASAEAFKAYADVLARGGKRLRGALTMCAYEMAGGTNQSVALEAARIIEMLHAYLLVIDDFSDRSQTRRGGPAAHILLQNSHAKHELRGDSEHFGESVAINAALLGCHMALEMVSDLKASDAAKVRALKMLNHTIAITGHGQIHDVFNEVLPDVSEAQVVKTLIWKTAYYTFLNPLQFGAILADVPEDDLQKLHEYSMHAGLAFQLADDILGTFGDKAKSGKSATDDLREGKMTLLIVHALEHATSAESRELRAILGNPDLTDADHVRAKEIIQNTGTLDFIKNLAIKHAEMAQVALNNPPHQWNAQHIAFLCNLAIYVAERGA